MPLIGQVSGETEITVNNNASAAYAARKQQERQQQDPISRTGTPSHLIHEPMARRNSAASYNSTSSSHSNNKGEERRRMAQAMKLPLKNDFSTNSVHIDDQLPTRRAILPTSGMQLGNGGLKHIPNLQTNSTHNGGNARSRSPEDDEGYSEQHNPLQQVCDTPYGRIVHTANAEKQTQKPPRTSTFDDTSNLSNWDDSSIPLQEEENQTTFFRGLNQQSFQPVEQRNTNNLAQPLATRAFNVAGMYSLAGKDVTVELQEARKAQAAGKFGSSLMSFGNKRGSNGTHTQVQDNPRAEDENYIQAAIAQGTPSRPQSVPSHLRRSIHPQKNVAFQQLSPSLNSRDLAREDDHNEEDREDSPELHTSKTRDQELFNMASNEKSEMPKSTVATISTSRTHSTEPKEQDRKSVSGQTRNKNSTNHIPRFENENNIPIRSTSETSTATDSLEGGKQLTESRQSPSVTDQRDSLPNRKRTRENEFDYDEETLQKKTYTEFKQEIFTTDPRNPTSEPAVDAQGNTMTLSQRLTNLSKMREEDQKTMLRSQTDEEWAQTGSWFIEKFQEDLKKLMHARFERRKVSMKYEDQIRRRQKSVEFSASSLDDELRELKNGGGKLIEGKKIGVVMSRVGTPRK